MKAADLPFLYPGYLCTRYRQDTNLSFPSMPRWCSSCLYIMFWVNMTYSIRDDTTKKGCQTYSLRRYSYNYLKYKVQSTQYTIIIGDWVDDVYETYAWTYVHYGKFYNLKSRCSTILKIVAHVNLVPRSYMCLHVQSVQPFWPPPQLFESTGFWVLPGTFVQVL